MSMKKPALLIAFTSLVLITGNAQNITFNQEIFDKFVEVRAGDGKKTCLLVLFRRGLLLP